MRFHRHRYDYYLIILTTLVLFAIGLICVYGITYYNYLSVDLQWTRTIQYAQYIYNMNSYLYPFLVLLLISLGLCIPKRLFEQDTLIKFSAMIMGVTLILTLLIDIKTGLGFILAVFNFVILRENPLHISIFWLGTILITAGNIFSFYCNKMT